MQLAHAEPSPVDVSLESTAGVVRSLHAFRGAPVVLFYEARDRLRDNDALKRAIERQPAHDRPRVIAAGDMRAFDRAGIRPVARAAARALASRFGFEIWLDWEGLLVRSPFSFDPTQSNVLLLDRAGVIVDRYTGMLGDVDVRRVLAKLRFLARLGATG